MLLQNGTLKVGDNIVAGMASGRVRAMVNDRGERVQTAGPSTPVEISGDHGQRMKISYSVSGSIDPTAANPQLV